MSRHVLLTSLARLVRCISQVEAGEPSTVVYCYRRMYGGGKHGTSRNKSKYGTFYGTGVKIRNKSVKNGTNGQSASHASKD